MPLVEGAVERVALGLRLALCVPEAQAVAVSVSASLLAAVYPLLRLRRLPLAVALRQE